MSFAKKALISLFFFCFVFIIWGFPYFQWGFVNDDYIFLFYGKNTPWSNILSFFYHGSPSNPDVVANAAKPNISFLVALYRPLLSLLFKIQISLFNLTPYWYKLAGIFIHSFVTITLFNLLLPFFSFMLVFWGCLFFAIHPSLLGWVGVFACQTYAYDLVFLLLCIIFLKKFIDSQNLFFYIIAIFSAFAGMLNRETLIFIPPWIIAAVYYYKENFAPTSIVLKNFFYAVKISIGFWIASIAYFAIKLSLFPFIKNDSGICFTFSTSSFFSRQIQRFFDVVTYFCDFFGVSLIPGNHRMLKGIILLIFISLLTTSFFLKKRKSLLFFLLFSFLLFNWPSLLIVHHARYIYVTLPFFLIILLFSISTYLDMFVKYKNLLFYLLYLSLVPLGFILMNIQYKTAQSLSALTNAIEQLSINPTIQNRSLIFIGLPMPWCGAGIEEGLNLFNHSLCNKNFYLKDTYKNGIKFLTETHHQTIAPTKQELSDYLSTCNPIQSPVFVAWNFKEKDFSFIDTEKSFNKK